MGNVAIPTVDVSAPEKAAVQGSPPTLAITDVGVIPNAKGLVLRIGNGATTTNVTIHAASVPGWHDLVVQINNGKTVWLPITDTTSYLQSDGTIHMTTDQALSSVIAITR